LADNEAIYSSHLVKIPSPEFIVVYNGTEEYAEESELKLSDAFMSGSGNLELKVKVYNINAGHNEKIMSRSETLQGYAEFVLRARKNAKSGLKMGKALEKAVKDCIRDNILKAFLEKYGSEVVNMLNMEFDLAEAQKVWKKDGIIEGMQQGDKVRKVKTAENLLKMGMTVELVAQGTELPENEVIKIKKRLKL